MHNIARNIIVVAGLIGLGLVGTLMNTGSNPGTLHAGSNVGVTVMSPIPLPVTGTVGVSGTPTVSLSGTPTVNLGTVPAVTLSGTSNVAVNNTATNPVPIRDVDNPGRHPFTASCQNSSGNAAVFSISCNPSPSAPAGAETVIQNISIDARSGVVNNTYVLSFGFTAGGNPVTVFLPGILEGPSDFVSNQLVALYADPLGAFSCQSVQSFQVNATSINCTISGYTVSLP